MPRLSQKTLDKMFPCPVCGKFFRTRQGLSGHIKFKHKDQTKTTASVMSETYQWMQKAKLLEVLLKTSGYSEYEYVAAKRIMMGWDIVRSWCKVFHVNVNEGDYKAYLVACFTRLLEDKIWGNQTFGTKAEESK